MYFIDVLKSICDRNHFHSSFFAAMKVALCIGILVSWVGIAKCFNPSLIRRAPPVPTHLFHVKLNIARRPARYPMKPALRALPLTGVSLDRSIIPRMHVNSLSLQQLPLALLLLAMLRMSGTDMSAQLCDSTQQLCSSLVHSVQNVVAIVAGLVSRVRLPGMGRRTASRKVLVSDMWSVCKLASANAVDSNYNKYRFEFEGYPNAETGLDIGQQVVLCSVDSSGRTVKKSFYPLSNPSARGGFEILGRRGAWVCASAVTDFDLALQFMEPGVELAAKAGEQHLHLPDSAQPIHDIALLVSGLGIVPALQLMRGVLEDAQSSIDKVSLLWINDGKREFLLNSEVEELQRLYEPEGRLSVTRVVDRELGNADTLINAQLREALPAHLPGVAGLVLAQGVAGDKCLRLLSSRGYPTDSIAQLAAGVRADPASLQ